MIIKSFSSEIAFPMNAVVSAAKVAIATSFDPSQLLVFVKRTMEKVYRGRGHLRLWNS